MIYICTFMEQSNEGMDKCYVPQYSTYVVLSEFNIKNHFTSIWTIITLKSGIIYLMMTSSNGNIFRVTGHLCGEFTGPRWIPHTKASDAELWCLLWSRPNKRLSKQWWGWWFETQSCPLWRHRNVERRSWYRNVVFIIDVAAAVVVVGYHSKFPIFFGVISLSLQPLPTVNPPQKLRETHHVNQFSPVT